MLQIKETYHAVLDISILLAGITILTSSTKITKKLEILRLVNNYYRDKHTISYLPSSRHQEQKIKPSEMVLHIISRAGKTSVDPIIEAESKEALTELDKTLNENRSFSTP